MRWARVSYPTASAAYSRRASFLAKGQRKQTLTRQTRSPPACTPAMRGARRQPQSSGHSSMAQRQRPTAALPTPTSVTVTLPVLGGSFHVRPAKLLTQAIAVHTSASSPHRSHDAGKLARAPATQTLAALRTERKKGSVSCSANVSSASRHSHLASKREQAERRRRRGSESLQRTTRSPSTKQRMS